MPQLHTSLVFMEAKRFSHLPPAQHPQWLPTALTTKIQILLIFPMALESWPHLEPLPTITWILLLLPAISRFSQLGLCITSSHTSSHSLRTLHRCCVSPQTLLVLLVSFITAAVTCNSPCILSLRKISCPVKFTLNKLLYNNLNGLHFICLIFRLLSAGGEGKRTLNSRVNHRCLHRSGKKEHSCSVLKLNHK